jgi:glycosyltransferase involved in cell wall biosynthesis
MLEPWAVRHKRLKKSIAWHLYQRRDLQRAQFLHATAAQEKQNLDRYDLAVPSGVIPNGVDLPDMAQPPCRSSEERTALFLGRISPVKGLPNLIEAWARLRPPGWRLRIAGPDEAGQRAALEYAAERADLRDVISFSGALDGEDKRAAFLNADVFVLPSHSESFGMAVAEALAHGVPVLTTTATPWVDLSARGCGWSVAPTAEGLTEGLRLATALAPAALRAMGAKGRNWMQADFSWPAIAERFLALYGSL